MSTILKALKKLEERKASEGKRQGDIAWDILREDSAKRPAPGRLPLLVASLVALLSLLALLAWLLWPPHHNLSASVEPRPSSSPAVAPAASPSKPAALPASSVPVSSPVLQRPEKTAHPDVTALLTVTGIAFHPDQGARMAIVNDLPVMVGTIIEGYVVERIESDRVEFSRGGERFSIPLAEHP